MKTKSIGKMMIIIMAMFCLLASFFNLSIGMRFASAEEVRYTSVLEDLQKDGNFNATDYPVDADDYSLKVIQIAESVNDELFVYVYQPCSPNEDLQATTIRISVTEDFVSDYDLILLNSEGVFYKYRVKGLYVSSEETRNYNIIAIHRNWNEEYDKPSEDDNVIDEVVYDVSQLWTVEEIEGSLVYSCVDSEVVEIVDKHVGFLRYYDGFAWTKYYTDSHYVAFSTDRPMENIVEAELEFVTYEYETLYNVPILGVDDRDKTKDVSMHVILNNEEVVENKSIGLFGVDYDFCRIETIVQFIANEDLTEETKNSILDKEWVLRFYESEYVTIGGDSGNLRGTATGVAEVSILRLKFETNGVVYNLGVVDNKQSGDNNPDNIVEKPSLEDWLKKLLIALGIVLGCFILAPFLPTIFTWIFKAIWWILKGLWWLIKAPFVAIKNLIDKRK